MSSRSLLLLLLLLSFALNGCSGNDKVASGVNGRVSVMVSIEPVAAFTEAVGGQRVSVTVMVPSGASPHTYEPRPSQLRRVSAAGLYVKVGSGVEFERTWMERIARLNPGMPVVDASEGVELLGLPGSHAGDAAHPNDTVSDRRHGHDNSTGFDPHIWVLPENAIKMVENIYAGLVRVDPAGREVYRENRDRYVGRLRALDQRVRDLLKGKRGVRVITYHPAWGYLAAGYGLVEVAIELEGKPPTPQGVAELVKRARSEGSGTIFTSPQFSSRAAEVIAKEIGGRVVSISPLERGYIENIERVATEFSKL